MDRIQADDLALRPELSIARLERRARLRDVVEAHMPDIDKAVDVLRKIWAPESEIDASSSQWMRS